MSTAAEIGQGGTVAQHYMAVSSPPKAVSPLLSFCSSFRRAAVAATSGDLEAEGGWEAEGARATGQRNASSSANNHAQHNTTQHKTRNQSQETVAVVSSIERTAQLDGAALVRIDVIEEQAADPRGVLLHLPPLSLLHEPSSALQRLRRRQPSIPVCKEGQHRAAQDRTGPLRWCAKERDMVCMCGHC